MEIEIYDALQVVILEKKFDEANIPYEIEDKPAGVHQVPMTVFKFSNLNYPEALVIYENVLNKQQSPITERSTTLFGFFRSKAFNLIVIAIPLVVMLYLFFYMIKLILVGDLMVMAWVGVLALFALIVLILKIFWNTIN